MYLEIIRREGVEGCWPQKWRLHNIAPIYKRCSVFQTKNYRGRLSCLEMDFRHATRLPETPLWVFWVIKLFSADKNAMLCHLFLLVAGGVISLNVFFFRKEPS